MCSQISNVDYNNLPSLKTYKNCYVWVIWKQTNGATDRHGSVKVASVVIFPYRISKVEIIQTISSQHI